MKKISIIIPVYNSQDFIGRCFESILANDFQDFEIIAIDDGSKDNSLAVLKDYAIRYPVKIRVYDQENQGVAKTRNLGISYAEGQYLMFVDNDDYVDGDYLKRFLAEIEKDDFDLVIGGYKRTNGKKTLLEFKLENTQWSKYMIMAPWGKIYKREFVIQNNLEFLDNNIGEDVYFNLQAINLTDKISIIDYCGYNWFYNEKSVSNSIQKNVKNEMNVLFLLESTYNKLKSAFIEDRRDLEFYFTRYVIWYLLFAGRQSSYGEIISEYEKTFGWLKEKFPTFNKNKSISLLFPEGETLKNKIAVYVFMLFYKFNLTKPFFRIYSK